VADHCLRNLALHVVCVSQQLVLQGPMPPKFRTERASPKAPGGGFDLNQDLVRSDGIVEDNWQADESTSANHRQLKGLVRLRDRHQ
jgi:hypothetical protein